MNIARYIIYNDDYQDATPAFIAMNTTIYSFIVVQATHNNSEKSEKSFPHRKVRSILR